jgi:hypothetical protein
LLKDLGHYGAFRTDLGFDWSHVVLEGHWTEFRGRMLESLSDVRLRSPDGTIVAAGWMDFVSTSAASDSGPTVFWLFLLVSADGSFKKLKKDAFVPPHIWASMTDAERQFGANTESKWLLRDPKVQLWKRQHPVTEG